jgi:hypothetical protein
MGDRNESRELWITPCVRQDERNRAGCCGRTRFAFCQNDDKEKGQQVALMGKIYEASDRTLICLGPGTDRSERQHACDVKALIGEVNKMIENIVNDGGFYGEWDRFPFPEAEDPLLKDLRWRSWEKLIHCPWFRRGWVVQEAALGRKALVLWTGVKIEWFNILQVHYWLFRCAHQLMPTLSAWSVPGADSRAY